MKKVFENQLHKQGPTGRANLFACVFGKLRASSDYHKRDRTRDLRSMLFKGFDRKKVSKGPRDALRLLREQDEFRNNRALSLDRFEIASKSYIKLNEKIKV